MNLLFRYYNSALLLTYNGNLTGDGVFIEAMLKSGRLRAYTKRKGELSDGIANA
jgi:hypothetical protein